MPTRYALFTLPGPGDAILARTLGGAHSPTLVIRAGGEDFLEIERLPAAPRFINRIELDTDPTLLKRHEIDLIIVAGWEERIPANLADQAGKGAWNIHPSLLPANRGHNPYFWTIANGDAKTGVTVHRLSGIVDAGPVLFRLEHPLDGTETLGRLWRELSALSSIAALELLKRIESGATKTQEQDHAMATRAPRVVEQHLALDPAMTRVEAKRRARAGNPFYGVTYPGFRDASGTPIRIYEIGDGEGPSLDFSDGTMNALLYRTSDGFTRGNSAG